MAVAFVRATYAEESKLQQFLSGLFGFGKTAVIWKRGRYQCTIPRRLTTEEIGRLREVVTIEHYDQAKMDVKFGVDHKINKKERKQVQDMHQFVERDCRVPEVKHKVKTSES